MNFSKFENYTSVLKIREQEFFFESSSGMILYIKEILLSAKEMLVYKNNEIMIEINFLLI